VRGWTDEAVATLEAAQHALFSMRLVPAPSVQGAGECSSRAAGTALGVEVETEAA
jgi:hypothetical protein